MNRSSMLNFVKTSTVIHLVKDVQPRVDSKTCKLNQ